MTLRDPLREFAERIVRLDEPEGPGADERRTVTLNRIINMARDALAATDKRDNNQ